MSWCTEETPAPEKNPAPAKQTRPRQDHAEDYETRKARALTPETRKKVEALDRAVCAKVNNVFMLSDKTARVRVARLYPQKQSMRRQDSAIVKARHYAWFFLYHHPAFEMGLKAIAALTGFDHSTICYGVHKMRHTVQARPYSIDAAALFELSKEMEGALGPVDLFAAARPRKGGRVKS